MKTRIALILGLVGRLAYAGYPGEVIQPINGGTGLSNVVTSSEFGFLAGVTASVQGQLNTMSGGGHTSNAVSGSFAFPLTITSDYYLNVNTTSGTATVTLPDATLSPRFCAIVKNVGNPANLLSVVPTGSQMVEFGSNDPITNFKQSKTYCANGGNWFVY